MVDDKGGQIVIRFGDWGQEEWQFRDPDLAPRILRQPGNSLKAFPVPQEHRGGGKLYHKSFLAC